MAISYDYVNKIRNSIYGTRDKHKNDLISIRNVYQNLLETINNLNISLENEFSSDIIKNLREKCEELDSKELNEAFSNIIETTICIAKTSENGEEI